MNLVFHQAALGDFAMILPLLRSLEGPTTLIAPWSRGRLASALIEHVSGLDIELFEFTRMHSNEGPHTVSPMVADLFAQANLVVSFVSRDDEPWAKHMARLAPQAQLICLDTRPPEGWADHLGDWHRQEVSAQGVALTEPTLAATGNPDGPVVIHPGSGGTEKCWPRENFEAVIAAYQKHHRPVRVIFGAAEAERWPQDELERWHAEYGAIGCASLEALVEQLMGASAYLGNDTGPTHLAAQLGLPVTALFGPTDPRHWAPRGPSVRVVAPPQPGGMQWLSVEAVLGHLGLD